MFTYLCWWLVFLFLIPLFVAASITPLSAWHGLVWGIIFFGLHFIAIMEVLLRMTDLSLAGFLASLLWVTNFVLLSTLWFWLASFLRRLTNAPVLSFAISTLLFFSVLYRLSLLLPFGTADGLLLAFPLLPLAQVPQTLMLLPWLGEEGLLLCLIGSSSIIGCRNSRVGWVALLLYLPFLCGFFWHSKPIKPPIDLNTIGYLQPLPWPHYNPYEIMNDIAIQAQQLANKHPEKKLILMPESTCCFPLNKYEDACTILFQELGDRVLLLGGYREEEKLYNSVYHISQDRISQKYNKTKLKPFTEYLPAHWNYFKFFRDNFLSINKTFSTSDASCSILHLPLPNHEHFLAIPVICWELYSATTDPCPHAPKNIPILALTNDAWYATYYQQLMFLSARFLSIKWQRPIFYIAHTGAWWLDGIRTVPIKPMS